MSDEKPIVVLRHLPAYEAGAVARMTSEAMARMGLVPRGRVLLKPNVVASGAHFPHAYTRPEFMDGVLRAVRERAKSPSEIAVGERCGITMPTRYAFQGAGYPAMLRAHKGVKTYHFEEETQVEVRLHHEGRLRDAIFVPESVARADFFVNCPKFKAHPWTTVTFGLKNYIGIQDDRHRLIDHDHTLNDKVADLQYVLQPQLIAIDAVVAGEGRMLTPLPFDLKLAIFGNNQVAVDAVCCQIIGLDPRSVPHIRMCHERGFGPLDLGAIRIEGDVSLAEARRRARGFRVGLVRVEEYFEGSSLRAYAGPPPSDVEEYCWGGCPGALEEAIEVMRLFDDRTDERLPATHVVFGAYDGPIEVEGEERVIFIGDCASWRGELAGQQFAIESQYVDRSEKSVYRASAESIYAKMIGVNWRMFKARNQRAFRMAGCPVSVAEQVLMLVKLGRLKNPYLDASEAWRFNNCYFSSRIRSALHRLMGAPYQRAGLIDRGRARPALNLPPGEGA